MPLHRDILWIGRQWSVTGLGMQVINQKYNGQFDIPIERLWDDDLPGEVSKEKWFSSDDFLKGLEVARVRHARPSAMPAAPPRTVERQLPSSAVNARPAPAPRLGPSAVEAQPVAAPPAKPDTKAIHPKLEPAPLQMRIPAHRARLARMWRVQLK